MDQKERIQESTDDFIRWLMLLLAFIDLWQIWGEIQKYQKIAAADILSPERLAVWAAEWYFEWLIGGTMAAIFLLIFATWKLPKNTRLFYMVMGIFCLLLAVVWGICAFFLPFHLLSGWNKVLLVLLLLALIGFGIYHLWNYHKLRKTTLDIV